MVKAKASRHLQGPVDVGVAVSKGRLQVPDDEAVENGMRDEEDQPES